MELMLNHLVHKPLYINHNVFSIFLSGINLSLPGNPPTNLGIATGTVGNNRGRSSGTCKYISRY